MAKHFILDIADNRFGFARKTEEIAAEAALDGIYVVRTSLPATVLDDPTTVRSYKSLSLVERAFRCLKSVDLQIRPVYHWLADRVPPTCFCACWPIIWNGTWASVWRSCSTTTPIRMPPKHSAPASLPRPSALLEHHQQTTGQTEDGLPVHSFRTLLADLATLTRNTLVTAIDPERSFTLSARHGSPTEGARPPRPRPYPVSPSLADYLLCGISDLHAYKAGSSV
jgi:hypothetical protein